MSNPMFAQRSSLALPSIAIGLALIAGGCSKSHHHHHGGGSSSPPIYDEIEPNDDPFFGDFIGPVDSRTHLFVEGHVDDDPGPYGDIYDHFEFVTDEAASFEVRLESFSYWNDVALGVFDPDTGDMVMWVDDPSGVHWADFTVHVPNKSFVLVVAATWGYGSYELELLGHSYAPFQAAGGAEAAGPKHAIEPLNPVLDLREAPLEDDSIEDSQQLQVLQEVSDSSFHATSR